MLFKSPVREKFNFLDKPKDFSKDLRALEQQVEALKILNSKLNLQVKKLAESRHVSFQKSEPVCKH